MATPEEEQKKLRELKEVLKAFNELKPDQFVRDDLGVELNFREGLPYFERTIKLFKDLYHSNIDSLPFKVSNNLKGFADSAFQDFQQIKSFSLQQHPNNPADVRNRMINTIRDTYDKYYEYVTPVIAYSIRKGTDFEKLEADAKEKIKNLDSLIKTQEESKEKMLSDIDSTLEKVKRAAQDIGVAQHATHFKNEADDHSNSANNWLIATGILAGLTLLVGIGSLIHYFYIIQELSLSKNIQLAVSKLIVFSILLTGAVWSGRTYRAHRHNFVINKHRQNALSTFETFIKSSDDPQTKSAVLIQTTQCIFSPQFTGYTSGEHESHSNPQVLEIIRGLSRHQDS